MSAKRPATVKGLAALAVLALVQAAAAPDKAEEEVCPACGLLLILQKPAPDAGGDDAGKPGGESGSGGGGSASLHITDHNDFCVFAPADQGKSLSSADANLISWCTNGDNGSRKVPDGTFTGVTVIKTDKWVQVSGV